MEDNRAFTPPIIKQDNQVTLEKKSC